MYLYVFTVYVWLLVVIAIVIASKGRETKYRLRNPAAWKGMQVSAGVLR